MIAAQGINDVIGPECSILFCGVNPGLLSGSTGYHFARPGNRFWKALQLSGLTDRLLDPSEQALLPAYGIGITNIVRRVSAAANELSREELIAGGVELKARVEAYKPKILAVLGLGAWRTAVDKRAEIGRQEATFEGATLFVLPNPSGLQARYQLPEIASFFGLLAAERARPARAGERDRA